MNNEKMYSCFSVEDADYDFNFYKDKDILSKMLENQTPEYVEKFDSTNTSWDLWGDIDDYFELYINGVLIETSTCVSSFINEFLLFLPHLAYTDDKKLICCMEYEGSGYVFITTPMENKTIRVSVYNSRMIYKYDPDIKFLVDIVIKKDTFLKQMQDILQQATVVDKKERTFCNWVNRIKYTISVLDKYFENPKKFKEEYEPKRHIRVFDVAYKTMDNNWEFKMYLEGDTEANQMYWLKAKKEGKILDYDFIEQNREDIFVWNEDKTELVKLTEKEIRDKLETNMTERIERNWVYSPVTNKWYSTNEMMPAPEEKIIDIIDNCSSYQIDFDTERYPKNEEEKLEDYVESCYDIYGDYKEDNLGYLTCFLTIKSDISTVCKIEFDYRNHKEIRNALQKAKEGEYVRFNLEEYPQRKMHIWQQLYHNSESEEARDIRVACYDGNDKELYVFTTDKNEFIDCFINALDEIQHKIEVMTHIMDIGKRKSIKKKFQYAERYDTTYKELENFIGNYSCVKVDNICGYGIINKNFEWVIKPEYTNVHYVDETGQKCCDMLTKYIYLHNIDGKLFIAQKEAKKQYKKQYVMNIKEEVQFPFEADKIQYTYLNNNLYFICFDEGNTFIADSKGNIILRFDFVIGEKFWLFEEIIIISKDNKFGIVDWSGKQKIDFIFSDIKPDNLDYIPVKYINQWGFINKNGKILDMKVKDKSEADSKCSQVENE